MLSGEVAIGRREVILTIVCTPSYKESVSVLRTCGLVRWFQYEAQPAPYGCLSLNMIHNTFVASMMNKKVAK